LSRLRPDHKTALDRAYSTSRAKPQRVSNVTLFGALTLERGEPRRRAAEDEAWM
jgi:hypothetical protein